MVISPVPAQAADRIPTSLLSCINYVKTFSPNLLNDFRFTAQRNNAVNAVPARKLPKPNELGIDIISDDPTGPSIVSFSSGMIVGFSNQGPTRLIDNTFTVDDNL